MKIFLNVLFFSTLELSAPNLFAQEISRCAPYTEVKNDTISTYKICHSDWRPDHKDDFIIPLYADINIAKQFAKEICSDLGEDWAVWVAEPRYFGLSIKDYQATYVADCGILTKSSPCRLGGLNLCAGFIAMDFPY